jgi:hypothetical protein
MNWIVNATLRLLYPRDRPGTHCRGGWIDLKDGLEWVRKISPTPGFDPRTVQSVASRYTDWVIAGAIWIKSKDRTAGDGEEQVLPKGLCTIIEGNGGVLPPAVHT